MLLTKLVCLFMCICSYIFQSDNIINENTYSDSKYIQWQWIRVSIWVADLNWHGLIIPRTFHGKFFDIYRVRNSQRHKNYREAILNDEHVLRERKGLNTIIFVDVSPSYIRTWPTPFISSSAIGVVYPENCGREWNCRRRFIVRK